MFEQITIQLTKKVSNYKMIIDVNLHLCFRLTSPNIYHISKMGVTLFDIKFPYKETTQ